MTPTPVPTLDTPGPRRAAVRPRRRPRTPVVPPMPRRLDLRTPDDRPALHTLHGPWTVTVRTVEAGAPPLSVTTW